MRIAVTVGLTLGLAAVVYLGVRGYAAQEAGWRLVGSLLPLSLIAGAVLALVGSNA